MAWKKGQSGNPAGRKQGVPNKVSRTVKESVVNVYEQLGGDEQFLKWARENQTEFFKHFVAQGKSDVDILGGKKNPAHVVFNVLFGRQGEENDEPNTDADE